MSDGPFNLRQLLAGSEGTLFLVMNVPGDAKPREVVEDTAVAVEDLSVYIVEFDNLMREKYSIRRGWPL